MRHSLALILLLSLTACSTTPSETDSEAKPRPATDMYSEAMHEMDDHNYEKAAKLLESLISRYPYGIYAQQSQMELAYAYYKQNDKDAYESALTAADRFLKDYPSSPNVDYVLYLKGVINFNADMGVLGNLLPRDLSEHDPQHVQDSFDAFKDLVTRFPNSKYAPDARARMQYLVNTLARHDINVARYYIRRGAYVAAVNRAKSVLKDYAESSHTLEALQVMVDAYDALGLKTLRDDAQRVLDLNRKNVAMSAPDAKP